MPRRRAGQWRNGLRQEANRTWTAKHGQLWSRGHPTRDDALKAKAKLANQRPGKGSRSETVRAWADRWLKVAPRPNESTNLMYAERVKRFVEEHGDKRLSQVTPEDCQKAAVEDPGRAKYVRVMFTDAVKYQVDGLEESPWRGIKVEWRSEGRRRITPLTEGEIQLLVQIAAERYGDWGRLVYGPMILTAAWTGMRPGELYGLEWRDIDWEAGTVHVRRQWDSKTHELKPYPKGYLDRKVPLAPQVVEALRQIPRQADYVFYTSQDGKRFNQAAGLYYWKAVRDTFAGKLPRDHWLLQRIRDRRDGRRQGTPDGSLDVYELRHFFASELGRRNVGIRDIATMLGHKDEGQLARTVYLHTDEREASDRVRQALWSRPEEPARIGEA
jgi:integrase